MTDYDALSSAYHRDDSGDRPVPKPILVRLSDVEPKAVEWLWQGRIPLGKPTMLDGDPGLGKSTLALDLAARVTRAGAAPDGTAMPDGGVVLLTAEDDLADTVRPRFDAMGGDAERLVVLRAVQDAQQGELMVSLPDHLPALASAITSVGAKLAIVDPFIAFVASHVDSKIDHHMRRSLMPLSGMAEELGVAVLLIRHLNKSGQGPAIYRGGGSIGIIGNARAGLLVAEDPDDPNQRVLATSRANLAAKLPSLTFSIAPASNGVGRVVWGGESAHSANQLLAATAEPQEREEVTRGRELLRSELKDGHRPVREIAEEAKAAGISDWIMRQARSLERVVSWKEGFDPGRWVMALPKMRGSPTSPRAAPSHTFAQVRQPPTPTTTKNTEDVELGNKEPSHNIALDRCTRCGRVRSRLQDGALCCRTCYPDGAGVGWAEP